MQRDIYPIIEHILKSLHLKENTSITLRVSDEQTMFDQIYEIKRLKDE